MPLLALREVSSNLACGDFYGIALRQHAGRQAQHMYLLGNI
jgi:hypothetical protein